MTGHVSGRQRVLLVTYNFPPKMGGLEAVALGVWEAVSRDSDVVVLAQGTEGQTRAMPGVHRPRREGLLRYFMFLYSRGMHVARTGGFDVVLSTSALTALAAVHLARRAKARSACIVHGLDLIHRSRIYQRYVRHALPRLDAVFANSRATRDEAVARGAPAERVEIIPPACDAAIFQEPVDPTRLRSEWALEGQRVILSPGRLVGRKGVDRFVRECLPLVVERVPNVKLLVAGGNPQGALVHRDDQLSAVVRAAEETGMSDRVVVTGRLSAEDMTAAFQLADVVVLPVVPVEGDMEGFGIVLLEAGAAGRPVVATRLGGITDAVVDGVTGLLVDPLDYGGMAAALAQTLTDEDVRSRLGAAAQKRVLEQFHWGAIGARYVTSVERLCAAR